MAEINNEEAKVIKVYSFKKKVTEEMLAVNVGSGTLPVLATPVVAALCEHAAMLIADEFLQEGETTVGSSITVAHTAPTALGAEVTVTAKLIGHEGRFFNYKIKVADAHGEVANGTHKRVAVGVDRFMSKVRA